MPKNCSSYIITVTATRTIRQNPVETSSAAIHDDATRRKSHPPTAHIAPQRLHCCARHRPCLESTLCVIEYRARGARCSGASCQAFDESAGLRKSAKSVIDAVGCRRRIRYVQAQQLLAITHSEISEIKTRADCASDYSRNATGIPVCTCLALLHARAEPSARLDDVLQLVEMGRGEVLAQHSCARMT